jgi:hypothetical protein
MPKALFMALAVLGLAVLQSAAMTRTAEAAIVCKDGFQNSGGNWISTPYCNDALLAQVARRRGVRVSDDEVRQSASKKYELCRMLEHHPEVGNYCPDSGGRDH